MELGLWAPGRTGKHGNKHRLSLRKVDIELFVPPALKEKGEREGEGLRYEQHSMYITQTNLVLLWYATQGRWKKGEI